MTDEPEVFNQAPQFQTVPLGEAGICLVLDDALTDPERMRQFALRNAGDFAHAPGNYYPGPQLALPELVRRQLHRFFDDHVRPRLGFAGTLQTACRMAMVTSPPVALEPAQCIPHTDSGAAPDRDVVASVLFLFEDPALGGTSFYVPSPKRPRSEVDAMMAASLVLPSAQFHARFAIPRGYPRHSDSYFEHVATVPARWNRMIFYRGSILHSADIALPGRLEADPRHGRLTLNGLFACTPT